MQAAQFEMGVRAHNIANVSTDASTTDLVGDMVGLMVAGHAYTANAKAFVVMAGTERTLLDVRA